MGKQTFGRAKKILSILLVVFFAISVTVTTVGADYNNYYNNCANAYWQCGYPYYLYNYDQSGNYCQGHWVCPTTSVDTSNSYKSAGGNVVEDYLVTSQGAGNYVSGPYDWERPYLGDVTVNYMNAQYWKASKPL
jgi:hypothetical protein